MLEEVNGTQLEEVLLQVQEQLRGLAPQNELIAMDGKEPKHGGGQSVLTAVCVPSQYYLGSAMVDTKTNEIPVAQKLFPDLDLKGRLSPWTPCTPKPKPLAISCWKAEGIIC